MNREHVKKMLPIFTAYAEGKKIEYQDMVNNWSPLEGSGSFENRPEKYRLYDEFRELKEAHADGKSIQHLDEKGEWINLRGNPGWCLPVEDYRIRAKAELELSLTLNGKPVDIKEVSEKSLQMLIKQLRG